MAKTKLPWLDYTGQTTDELLACKASHRIDSLLCAFEWGIQAKAKSGEISEEENLVLAVMALSREVNNGGYSQFFINSSRRYAPIIVDCLRRIDCVATTAITERVMAAVDNGGSERDAILNQCDQQFYKLNEITPNLFRFIEDHQNSIQLEKVPLPPPPPRPERSTAAKLGVYLMLTKKVDPGLDGSRRLARELAQENGIAATEADLEAAAVLHAFTCALAGDDWSEKALLATRAFELTRDDTSHCVHHKKWVLQLLEAPKNEMADTFTLDYLVYLTGCDQSTLSTRKRILFWAAVIQKNREALPRSVAFFIANFPDNDLNTPVPELRFVSGKLPPNFKR